MATTWPWAGFGNVRFRREELPIMGSDSGWNASPSYSESRPLGSVINSIVTLAIGSEVRQWEQYLEPDRLTLLKAMINTTHTLTDADRPAPEQRTAFLRNVEIVEQEIIGSRCIRGDTKRKVRAKLTFVSQ